MAAMLRASGRTPHATGTLLSLLLRLLAYKPDRALEGLTIGGQFAKTRAAHATALRNAALGVMSCVDLKPEQALRYADLEEVEQEVAVKKLQGMRRAQIRKRKEEEAARQREAEDCAAASRRHHRRQRARQAPSQRSSRSASTDVRGVGRDDECSGDGRNRQEEGRDRRPAKSPADAALGLLEDLVHTSASMNTRFAECCASALCSLVTKPTVAGPLAAVDALSRILALCGHIQQQVPLPTHASVAHGYLAAAALSLLEAKIQRRKEEEEEKEAAAAYALLNPPPPPPKPAASPSPEKKSKDKGGRDRSPSPPPDSPVEITDPEELARLEEEERLAAEEAAIAAQLVTAEQLAILVGMLPASQSGALHGSSALWLMANAGYVEILGDLGAVEALSAALTIATDEKKLAGNFLLQAIWSCAALWRLAHDPTNAGKALISAAPTLLKLLPSGLEEHDTLRKAALGCVSLMLKQPELQPPLVQMAAPGLLRDIAASVERPVEQRLTATRTLDEAVVTVGDKLLPPPPPPSSSLPSKAARRRRRRPSPYLLRALMALPLPTARASSF